MFVRRVWDVRNVPPVQKIAPISRFADPLVSNHTFKYILEEEKPTLRL